jgi:hypothetical protein
MRLFPFLFSLAILPGAASAADPDVPPFHAILLRGGGGEAIVRHGAAQRVTILEGDSAHSRFAVEKGRLIVTPCIRPCPRSYRLRLSIIVPALDGLFLSDGGTIRTEGPFPRQPNMAASVSQGGTIDIRSLDADSVAASVESGGRILARPGASLAASVAQGGIVTYWGTPSVSRSIRGGGVVERGEAADSARPLEALESPPAPLAPLPRLQRR